MTREQKKYIAEELNKRLTAIRALVSSPHWEASRKEKIDQLAFECELISDTIKNSETSLDKNSHDY